ncbi:MAG: hypothetical protein Q8N01_01335 [Sulfuricurvum sp.]|nr:hypothetical protein [Sulfuricurvum sp.]MDP3023715.1 hypothetical protein [Sulfuricurvum sp.]MDP3119047.1 hypothetical protein [Sulfuricurvum sp.]
MSKNEVSENLINHYLEPQKGKRTSLKSLKSSKKTGNTLNDFYSEVQAKKNISVIENIYNGKNATQIEMIMIQNRKLIETNYTKR